jgi:hypothetical protein
MSSEQVRILVKLDPEIEFNTVPANEVPADHVPVHLVDLGDFYASPELLGTMSTRAEHKHPEFPSEVRESIRRFERVFDQVHPQTVEQWEDGFRRDRHSWGEIALWDWWADTVERFTTHLTGTDATTQEKRKEITGLVLSLSRMPSAECDAVAEGKTTLSGFRTLSTKRIREIVTWMFSDERATEKNARREQYRKLIQGKDLPGPNRIAIDALFDVSGIGLNRDADFSPTDLINAADVILGVSREDDHEFVLYGKDLLERIAMTGNEEPGNVLRIEMDQETHDLERVVALVEVLKGHHDYPGGTSRK